MGSSPTFRTIPSISANAGLGVLGIAKSPDSSETPYVDGKKHGKGIAYHLDVSKKAETFYENGKQISKKAWDIDGNLIE